MDLRRCICKHCQSFRGIICQCCSQTWHLLAQVGVLGLLVIYAQACELYTGRQFDLLSKYPYS